MTEKPQKNRDLTLPACLWLGLFPLLHLGSYATLTRDKWFWMLALTAVTLACFIWSLVSARRPLPTATVWNSANSCFACRPPQILRPDPPFPANQGLVLRFFDVL